MTTEGAERPDGLRIAEAELDELAARFERGDLTAKRFAGLRQDALACVGRAKIGSVLGAGEVFLAEHHWVEGARRLPLSPFAETMQVAGSLYVTDRRVFRWRFQDSGSPGARRLEKVPETLEFRWWADLVRVGTRFEFRWGEFLAGLVIAAAALGLYPHLSVTGPFLLGVAAFGVLHAVLVPTRVRTLVMASGERPWDIWAARTRSGRALVAVIERRIGGHLGARR